jgi:hypothetical protein
MTSSARATINGGIVRPSSSAVLRLMTSSKVVGCWTGRSAGSIPSPSSRPASHFEIASCPLRTDLPSYLIAKRLSLVAGRQLNSALARVALLTVCEGGEPSVNAICA